MSLQSMITAFDFFANCSIFAILLSIAFLFILHLLISLTDLIHARHHIQEEQHSAFYSQTKELMQTKNYQQFTIDAGEFLDDVAENYIFDSPDHYALPADIFEGVMFKALNDLIDDFSLNPHHFLKPHHFNEIDCIAAAYPDS